MFQIKLETFLEVLQTKLKPKNVQVHKINTFWSYWNFSFNFYDLKLILDLHQKTSLFEIVLTEIKNPKHILFTKWWKLIIINYKLFVQEKFEIFLIMSILIYYKQLLLSVELKRSSADYFVIQYTKTNFSHLDWVTQENILHVVVLEHML